MVAVAAITGHKDLKMRQRYTHLRAEDYVFNCQVMTHKEIEAILQKQIEALKEKMKDNKI